ncbi:Hypothetical protein CINCED_3A021239 [Cinara cedri]|uniref:Uncharacterized protein n=1 Tax=Cinara cedri TaxID=506608 RepID=A0A5E4NCQ7_9HEMI|nr:Hypothetical protein CINCED_3A021239 [Cinara cedri]
MAPVSCTVNLALAATAVALVLKTKDKKQKRKLTKDWLLKRLQYSHEVEPEQYYFTDQTKFPRPRPLIPQLGYNSKDTPANITHASIPLKLSISENIKRNNSGLQREVLYM